MKQLSSRPRVAKLPNGQILSVADLPQSNVSRWTASRKLLVVRSVVYGLMTQAEAVARYGLSDEEFTSWIKHFLDHGHNGLKCTKVKEYRQP